MSSTRRSISTAKAPATAATGKSERGRAGVAGATGDRARGHDAAVSGHDFGRIRATHLASAPMRPARGETRNGAVSFTGSPSPLLVAHELVHVAQQRLGGRTRGAASRAALEDEARALAPRLAAGHAVDVGQVAPAGMALAGSDPEKTYTSTVEIETNDQFIKRAKEYHQKWGYNPIDVASIEEITDDLASGTGTLSRIRIVSHASQINLYMQFAKGGPDPVMEEELFATTQKETEQAGVTTADQYVDGKTTEDFRDYVEQKESALAGRLTIAKAGITDDHVRHYFTWLLNKHRATGVPGPTQADRDLIMPAIRRQIAAARTVVATNSSIASADLTALETLVESRGFSWSALPVGDALEQVFARATSTHEAFASRDLAKKQTKVRARFTKDSTIEIRGCALGQNQTYMEGIQNYFGSPAGKPAVQAPDWYQFYGTIGLYVTKNTDAMIKNHWTKNSGAWTHSKDLRDSFVKWAPVYAPSQQIPQNPTWQDLATYLRAGHVVPYQHGARLFALKDMTEDQVIDWFTKNDQRLTGAAAIKNQFASSKVSEEATKSSIFEWLQENFNDQPNKRLFPYDPGWAGHFKLIPGK